MNPTSAVGHLVSHCPHVSPSSHYSQWRFLAPPAALTQAASCHFRIIKTQVTSAISMQEIWIAWEGSSTFPRQKKNPCNAIAWGRLYQSPAVIAEVIQHRLHNLTKSYHIRDCPLYDRTDLHSPRITRWRQCSNAKTFVCLTTPLNSMIIKIFMSPALIWVILQVLSIYIYLYAQPSQEQIKNFNWEHHNSIICVHSSRTSFLHFKFCVFWPSNNTIHFTNKVH